MAHLSILAEMLDNDLDRALTRLDDVKMSKVDLKNHIFGAPIEGLNDEQRRQLATMLDETGVQAYCFATTLGHLTISQVGESDFRDHLNRGVENLLRTTEFVRPNMIRLLACRAEGQEPIQWLEQEAPWVYAAYRDAIKRLNTEGLHVTIENEPDSVLSSPTEVRGFFDRLDLRGDLGFTWDIQNMWQAGTYPSLDVYQELKPVIDYVHVKGGRDSPSSPKSLVYRSVLEDAAWPVEEVLEQVLQDDVSPVICLNTSHGKVPENYEFGNLVGSSQLSRAEAEHDAAFLRRRFEEIQ